MGIFRESLFIALAEADPPRSVTHNNFSSLFYLLRGMLHVEVFLYGWIWKQFVKPLYFLLDLNSTGGKQKTYCQDVWADRNIFMSGKNLVQTIINLRR